MLRYLFLDFHFYRSIGKSEKGFEKLSLRTAVLHLLLEGGFCEQTNLLIIAILVLFYYS